MVRTLLLEALATGPASADALTWVALRIAETRRPTDHVSHQAVSAALRRMCDAGLVRREPVPGTRTGVYLLTPAGRRARRDALDARREAEALDRAEREASFAAHWSQMRDSLDTRPVPGMPGWVAWRQSGMLQLVRAEPWARTSSVHMAGWHLGPDEIPEMLIEQAQHFDRYRPEAR